MNTFKLAASAAMTLAAIPAAAQTVTKETVDNKTIMVVETANTRTVTMDNATLVYDKNSNLLGMKSVDASGNVTVLGNLNPSREEAAMFSPANKPSKPPQVVYAKKF